MQITPDPAESLPVNWRDVVGFVRQLTHDIRNDLNVLELEIALMDDPQDLKADRGRDFAGMRTALQSAASRLRLLAGQVGPVTLREMSTQVGTLLEVAREKIDKIHPGGSAAKWIDQSNDLTFTGDLPLLVDAVVEVVENGIEFREQKSPIGVTARHVGHSIRIEVSEPKGRAPSGLDRWGLSPLAHVRRGHYGLGLFYAESIVAAHCGAVERVFDPQSSVLTTSLIWPVVKM